jgi:Predicted acetyltransferase
MIKIFKETDNDSFEIENLYDLTFGPGRRGLTSYQFRTGINKIAELSLVLRDQYGVLVGAIRYWPILVGWSRAPNLFLGPIGVHPTRQGEGLGQLLIEKSVKKAKFLGWKGIILVGDSAYYGRFSFSDEFVSNLYINKKVNTERLLGRELERDSLRKLSGPIARWDS